MVRIRKAAVVMASLPPSEAAALAARMSPAQLAAVYSEMARLAPVQSDELRQAAQDLFRQVPARPILQTEETVRPTARVTRSRQAACEAPSSTCFENKSPFHFLEVGNPNEIARQLEIEGAQTTAVVLSQVSRTRANQILVRLPAALQLEVTRRLAELEPVSPDILDDLARGLRRAWQSVPILEPVVAAN